MTTLKRSGPEIVPDSDSDDEVLSTKLFSNGLFKSDANDEDSDSGSSEDGDVQEHLPSRDRAAVWQDVDDDDLTEEVLVKKNKTTGCLLRSSDPTNGLVGKPEYQKRLREEYVKKASRGKQPKWAKIQEVNYDSDDDVDAVLNDVTRSAGKYIEDGTLLRKHTLGFRLLQDIALGHPDSRQLNIMLYHRVKPVLIAAGDSGLIRLFQVHADAKQQSFLQSVQLKNFPITSCDFLHGGTQLLLGSRSQPFFMKYDMETNEVLQIKVTSEIPKQNFGKHCVSRDGTRVALVGHRGQVYLFDGQSFNFVQRFNAPVEIADIHFFPGSSEELWALGENSRVYIWSSSTKELHTFFNQGAVHGTALALSPDGRYVAIGENTGFVNVYATDAVRKTESPETSFSITNLVTAVDSITFNHDSKLMVIASSLQKQQVRVVHMASQTIYQNFPERREKLGHIYSAAFSPHGAYLALGMKNGGIRSYRIEHFENY